MSLTVSIETGIQGGSIALFEGRNYLNGIVATENVSSAERVLIDLENLLTQHELQRTKIKKIVLSSGPGSSTGLRIGQAIALGLKKTLQCDLISFSTLDSMLAVYQKSESVDGGQQSIIVAVPIGRNQITAIHSNNNIDENFRSPSAAETRVFSYEEFTKAVRSAHNDTKIILHDKLYREIDLKLNNSNLPNKNIINAGANLAKINGLRVIISNIESVSRVK